MEQTRVNQIIRNPRNVNFYFFIEIFQRLTECWLKKPEIVELIVEYKFKPLFARDSHIYWREQKHYQVFHFTNFFLIWTSSLHLLVAELQWNEIETTPALLQSTELPLQLHFTVSVNFFLLFLKKLFEA